MCKLLIKLLPGKKSPLVTFFPTIYYEKFQHTEELTFATLVLCVCVWFFFFPEPFESKLQPS